MMRTKTIIALLGCALLTACGASDEPSSAPAEQPRTEDPAPEAHETSGVGSSQFELELGQLYERYRDPASAATHYRDAFERATEAGPRVQALTGLARSMAALQRTDDGIEALERALDVIDEARGDDASNPDSGDRYARERVLTMLAGLHADAGRHEDATAVYDELVAAANDPRQLTRHLRELVAIHRGAGTLAEEIARREAEIESADEASLRFLAIAYDGTAVAGPGDETAPSDASKLAAVYERLHELRPEDPDVRRGLIRAYEHAERLDAAEALLRTSAGAESAVHGESRALADARARCPSGLSRGPVPPEVAAAEEVVSMYARAKNPSRALAEVDELVALGRDRAVGVHAYVAGARLYASQGRDDLANETFERAARAARSAAEKRAVALARAELLMRSGDEAKLAELYQAWSEAEDPCLRAEGLRRSL